MSVLSYNEIAPGRGVSGSVMAREWVRVWLFICDWPSDPTFRTTDADIYGMFGSVQDLPTLYYSQHPRDASAYCDSIKVDQLRDQPHMFTATVHYKTPDGRGDTLNDQAQPNPLLRVAQVTWGYTTITEAITESVPKADDDLPILIRNSAGDQFDPPLTDERTISTVTITRNEPNFSVEKQKMYQDTRNAAAFSGYGVREAWLRYITAQTVQERGTTFTQVTYEIWFNEMTWDRFVPNVGFVGYVAVPGAPGNGYLKKELVDADGKQFTTPRALKGTESVDVQPVTPQPAGINGQYLPDGPVNLRRYNTKRVVDWTPLNLPSC